MIFSHSMLRTEIWRQNTSPYAPQTHIFLLFPHTWQLRKTFYQRVWRWLKFMMSLCVWVRICQMTSYRHMFHRNLRGLPDHPPAFPATLVTESGNTSECTHMKTNEAGHLISPLFTQEQEVSANPFGVSVFQQEAESGRQQQPASSSVVISEVCHCLNMTEKNAVWKEESPRRSWQRSSCTSSSRWMFSSEKIIWGWNGDGQKKLQKEKIWYCSIRNQPTTTGVTKIGVVSGESLGWSSSTGKQ